MSRPKCLQTEKSVPLRNIDKLFNPNLEPCQVLYHSRSRLDLTIMMMKGSFYSPLPKSTDCTVDPQSAAMPGTEPIKESLISNKKDLTQITMAITESTWH